MLLDKLKRPANLAIAATLLVATALPVVVSQKAHAYGLLGSRSIQLTDSSVSASGVTYKVTFNAATTATIKSFAVDFCSNSPIIGQTCSAVAGFNVGTPTITGFTINGSPQTWTYAKYNSNRTISLTDATGVAITAGQTITFDMTGVTNPSSLGTFYGRILTYPNDSGANSASDYGGGTIGTPTDAGGIALSTASQITVTSKVQERLNFCVYTGANCGAGGTAVTLGDTNGVLDPAGPYVDRTTKYDVGTNASGNVAIRIKGNTLNTGGFTITGNATPVASSLGTEQFGFCTYESTAGSSALAVDTAYDGDAAGTNPAACTGTTQTAGTGSTGGDNSAAFTFDTSSINTTYGQTFVSKPPGSTSTGTIAFIGNIANTTEAGIYATTLTFIATGTY